MDDLAIEVKDLSFRYRQTTHAALSHVSFSVPQGSFFCIIGGNGVGKSTLCNTFVGLIPHYFLGKMDGDVRVNGQSISELRICLRRLGWSSRTPSTNSRTPPQRLPKNWLTV